MYSPLLQKNVKEKILQLRRRLLKKRGHYWIEDYFLKIFTFYVINFVVSRNMKKREQSCTIIKIAFSNVKYIEQISSVAKRGRTVYRTILRYICFAISQQYDAQCVLLGRIDVTRTYRYAFLHLSTYSYYRSCRVIYDI